MKIAIETTALFTSRAGVARYVRGLLAGMKAAAPPMHGIVELGWKVENFEFTQPLRTLKTAAREWGWAKFIAPRCARGAAVVHHTALPIVPFFRGPRHVVTLHDLALLRHPDRFRRWQRRAGVRRLRQVAQADRVICVSQFTADEAMALLGLPAANITVVHEGGWLPTAVAGENESVEMPAEFFLFVGSLEPGKNLALLRQAYADAAEKGSPLPPLLIAGGRWPGVAHEGPPPREWRFLGHVSDAQLRLLYCRARALVFPSRYEGFGLPLVEAMAVGCPVICAPVASLREIGDDAVYYSDLTAAGFGAAMRRVMSDAALDAHLRTAGVTRASHFSWEKCARETLDVYESATRG